MVKEVFIENLPLTVSEFSMEMVKSEPTNNNLRKIVFTANITGESVQKTIEDLIGKPTFNFHVPGEIDIVKVKKENGTWSYKGNALDENTIITYKIELVEHDKDLPEEWNMFSGQLSVVIMNWIRTRALSELLVEKGLITNQEYVDKITQISKRDFDNLANYIRYGLPESKTEEE